MGLLDFFEYCLTVVVFFALLLVMGRDAARNSRPGPFLYVGLAGISDSGEALFSPLAMPPLPGPFQLQGHRGARGLKPENTLPAFEAALDAGVSSVEADLHLTRDGVIVLCHEPLLDSAHFSPPIPDAAWPAIADVTIAELRAWRADRNPDPRRFPRQDAKVTPLAAWFAQGRGIDPFAVPTLSHLFEFAASYAGGPGARAGKSHAQRAGAARAGFDLELKCIPFRADRTLDALERGVVEAVRAAEATARTTVRSFDHRSVRRLRALEPRLTGAILMAHAAPVAPGEMALGADARIYCPSYDFLDEEMVVQAHALGVRVMPWTVNEPDDWKRLIGWGVDGLTTDYPDRLAANLKTWGVAFGVG
jgi:glycerophosphoryl diester phosphodiesterase